MNCVILGILYGIVFGMIDAGMVVFGKHPDRSPAMLLQAFSSRFAIGFLAANVAYGLEREDLGAGFKSALKRIIASHGGLD